MTSLDDPAILRVLFPESGETPEAVAREDEVAGGVTVEELPFWAPDDVRLVGRIFPGLPTEPHILFFPGEESKGDSPAYLAKGFSEFGFNFLSLDYRGCGASGGEPCASSLLADAEAFFQAVLVWREGQERTGPLVFMGRSLGSAVALDLAARHAELSLALVIESGFNQTASFLEGLGLPVEGLGLAGEDPFQNRPKMKGYEKPVLFLHSQRDPVVRIPDMEWVVAESRSKATQFQIVPGEGRFDLAHRAEGLYFTFIRGFLYRLMGRRLPRRRMPR